MLRRRASAAALIRSHFAARDDCRQSRRRHITAERFQQFSGIAAVTIPGGSMMPFRFDIFGRQILLKAALCMGADGDAASPLL